MSSNSVTESYYWPTKRCGPKFEIGKEVTKMGELDEWGKAIGNLIRSGGTTTSDSRDRSRDDRGSHRSNNDDDDDDWPLWDQSEG